MHGAETLMEPLSPDLLRGSLELMVLSVLADGPRYGYLIQQQLRATSREMVDIQAGTLYPILHRLEKDKAIRAKWDESTGRPRKWYELTAAGRKRLVQRTQNWEAYVECVRRVIQPGLDPSPSPV